MKTSIEWTDYSWNPIRARRRNAGHTLPAGKLGHYCQKISPGCKNCYAAAMNLWRGNGIGYTVPEFAEVELYLDADALLEPLRWKKPRNVFVCSMTDLFADFILEEWIEQIYAVMALADRHTFMVLTKRPARRKRWYEGCEFADGEGFRDAMVEGQAQHIYAKLHPDEAKSVDEWLSVCLPLKNVREGTSICTQKEAEDLLPIVIETPAALRWLSLEPLLETIDLAGSIRMLPDMGGVKQLPRIDWIVVGGESGWGARETDISAIRSIVKQCKDASVPVFVKQVGARAFFPPSDGTLKTFLKISDAKGGNPADWPVDLRIREFPEVAHARA